MARHIFHTGHRTPAEAFGIRTDAIRDREVIYVEHAADVGRALGRRLRGPVYATPGGERFRHPFERGVETTTGPICAASFCGAAPSAAVHQVGQMPRGRSSRNPENREAILRLLRAGNTRQDTALYVGMDPVTLRRWMSGEVAFQRECEQAEAMSRVHAVAVVTDDARGRRAEVDDYGNVVRAEVRPNVSSAMWLLERRDPMNWGRRITVDIRETVAKYAAAEGLDADDVMAEVEALMAENAERYRRTQPMPEPPHSIEAAPDPHYRADGRWSCYQCKRLLVLDHGDLVIPPRHKPDPAPSSSAVEMPGLATTE